MAATLTPTSAYLHSIFDDTRCVPFKDMGQRKPQFTENDVFAAAFNLATDCIPKMGDDKHVDPFNIFCEMPSPSMNQCDPQLLELSPPESANYDFSYQHDDVSYLQLYKLQNCMALTLYKSPAIDLKARQPMSKTKTSNVALSTQHDAFQLSNPFQQHELPPTPATQTYTSPYSNASPTISNLPPPLKPRRRGPKPKSQSSKSKEEKDEIHKRFLERNKQAAKRCRERKKLGIEATQRLLREQEREVAVLRQERDYLMLEIKELKGVLSECTCGRSIGSDDGREDSQDESEDAQDTSMIDPWVLNAAPPQNPE